MNSTRILLIPRHHEHDTSRRQAADLSTWIGLPLVYNHSVSTRDWVRVRVSVRLKALEMSSTSDEHHVALAASRGHVTWLWQDIDAVTDWPSSAWHIALFHTVGFSQLGFPSWVFPLGPARAHSIIPVGQVNFYYSNPAEFQLLGIRLCLYNY